MARRAMTEDAASDVLTGIGQRSNRTLREMAEQVVHRGGMEP
ncbi:ANTAR domain-containing protein [Modestobacter sp. DSM 44400]|nr:ANTAR domain-containing protein [Modestobacter sp. DSM 44400]SDY55248.1 ANTAR domain-containing protein [Modestobacter sp. DSM 44400]